MQYFCRHCGKTAVIDSEILFCPFCGMSFHADQKPQMNDQVRIVIGSDSERNIENKYWSEAEDALDDIGFTLLKRIENIKRKTERVFPPILIEGNLRFFLENSNENAERKMRRRMNQIAQLLNDALKTPERQRQWAQALVMDIRGEKQFNQQVYGDIESVFHCPFDYSMPENDEDDLELENDCRMTRYAEKAYQKLLDALNESNKCFCSIIQDNTGSFQLPYASSIDYEDGMKIDPEKLADELLELSQKDYDFIFGEDPAPFLQKTWDAIVYLSYTVNDMMNELHTEAVGLPNNILFEKFLYNQLEQLEQMQSEWQQEAKIQLDKVYRSQKYDMINIVQELNGILKGRISDGHI